MINKIDLVGIKTDNNEDKIQKEKKDLKKVSQEFEAIFLKKIMDEMDKTIDKKDSMFYGGNAEDVFQGMLNDERAKEISKSGGIGLSEMIYKQLSQGIDKVKK